MVDWILLYPDRVTSQSDVLLQMHYTITWTETGVTWTYTGLLTGNEILKSNDEIYGDPRFDDLRYQIVDMTDATSFEVSEVEMKQMAHLDKAAARTNPNIRLAVVAPSGAAREVADAYANNSNGAVWESKIFESLDEAKTWLEI